eukprot:GILI01026159.1.p1 GENE.GILI01026159.1~~GILI01026159.1.p1  ORF type:complete len:245 (+),score=23.00 GILI01026159.1:43-735(+)
MVLPLLKIGVVFVSQASKPLSARVKSHMKNHPTFRAACISAAQRLHAFEAKIAQSERGGYQARVIRPLNEEKAVENAATLASELFIIAVVGAAVSFEYARTSANKAEADRVIEERFQALHRQIETLQVRHNLIMKRLLPANDAARHKSQQQEQDQPSLFSRSSTADGGFVSSVVSGVGSVLGAVASPFRSSSPSSSPTPSLTSSASSTSPSPSLSQSNALESNSGSLSSQ